MAKPRKAEKPTEPVKQADNSVRGTDTIKMLDEATAEKLVDQIFSDRKELLHKLAH